MKGTAYLGSSKVEISVANKEIVPRAPEDWTMDYKLYKFSIMNYGDCTIKINGKTDIFLKANQGFNISKGDAPITSLKIKEKGIEYSWVGAY